MRFSLLALALTASGLVAQERQKPKADLILYGGVVYRGGETPAQAVAVRGNLILAVGGTESMLGLCGPKTRVIPLRGRLVVPGFNDNHVHFASAARFLEFNIMTTTTQAEFVEWVKDVGVVVSDQSDSRDLRGCHEAEDYGQACGWVVPRRAAFRHRRAQGLYVGECLRQFRGEHQGHARGRQARGLDSVVEEHPRV